MCKPQPHDLVSVLIALDPTPSPNPYAESKALDEYLRVKAIMNATDTDGDGKVPGHRYP